MCASSESVVSVEKRISWDKSGYLFEGLPSDEDNSPWFVKGRNDLTQSSSLSILNIDRFSISFTNKYNCGEK